MRRTRRRLGTLAALVLASATGWLAFTAPTSAATGPSDPCALDGGGGVCDAISTSGEIEPGARIEVRATADSCGQPSELLWFPGGFSDDTHLTPVGEGQTVGVVTPGTIFEGAFVIPDDAEGPSGFALRCERTGDYTASGGIADIVAATTTTAPPSTTATTEPTTSTTGELAAPVVAGGSHPRPAISAVRTVGDVSTDAGLLAANLVIAALLVLIAFPAELFNATFEEHYDEISGWFAGPKRALDRVAGDGTGSPVVPFAAATAVVALLYAFLDPEVSVDQATTAMVLGVGLSIAAAVMISGLVARQYVARHHEDRGRLRIYPGAVFVAAACVIVSRLVDFQPGYLYGVIAGFAFTAPLSREEDGRAAARVGAAGLAVSVASWLLLSPVRDLMDDPQPGFVLVLVEAFLAAMFVGGLQALVFGFLPLRFLPGRKVWLWSKPVWAALFGVGVFGFLQVLLHPESSYEGSVVTMVVLFVAFAALSVGFWAFFRGRQVRGASEGGLDDAEAPAEDADHVEAQ